MKIVGTNITGSVLVNGNDVTTNLQNLNTWSGSVASNIVSLNSYTASQSTSNGTYATTASLHPFTASVNSFTASQNVLNGTFATTGSNTFVGKQYISDTTQATSFAATASLYTDGGLRVGKDTYISGSTYVAGNLVVFGTSSIQYVTSSALIGLEYIDLNTDLPAVRYAGIRVYDSGSNAGVTGSLLWDSQNNRWIYSNPSGSSYDGAMLISGPRNSSGLGNEVGTTNNALMKGQGGDHITSSAILDDGTSLRIPYLTIVTGTVGATTFSGSGANLTSIPNAALTNSSITVTAGTGLSGGGSVALGSSITLTNTITNNNQLTNGAGYITSAGTTSGNVVVRSQSNWNDSTIISNVIGLMAWKNYGNSHVIFDASAGTSPSGGGVSTTNATYAWTSSYPTLMGWNGSSTYGVRVDSARVSDNTSGNSATTSQRTFSNVRTDGINRGSYGSISVAGSNNTYGGIDFTDQSMTLMIRDGATGFYYTNNTWRVYWDGSGNQNNTGDVTAYASDKRLKTNITNIPNALDKIRSINGVTFDWKLDECNKWNFNPPKNDVGVIAQEIQLVQPEAVTFAPFDRDPVNGDESKSGENYLTVKYEKLVPLLIEAIKEQQSQIEELKAKLG